MSVFSFCILHSAFCNSSHRLLKNCTAFSCFSAAAREENVPRFRRLPVFGFFLREYSRYSPELNLRIMVTSEDAYKLNTEITENTQGKNSNSFLSVCSVSSVFISFQG